MLAKVSDGNGGKWVFKRKMFLATIALLLGYAAAFWMISKVATFVAGDIATVLGALTLWTAGVLTPIYAADIIDKSVNGPKGLYHSNGPVVGEEPK